MLLAVDMPPTCALMFFPLNQLALSRGKGQNEWMLGQTGFEEGERAQSLECAPPPPQKAGAEWEALTEGQHRELDGERAMWQKRAHQRGLVLFFVFCFVFSFTLELSPEFRFHL